ncbi:MAG: hypothetical protein Q7T11_00970 [Deltaproteobacteria bacterium]|nr:hypothetical protein [Deltaproteobacteria bacterium]
MTKPEPFPFERLKKYSSREASLFNWLVACFPSRDFSTPGLLRLTEVMKKYLGSSFSIQYESLFEAPFGQFAAGLPDKAVIPVVSLAPHPKKVLIEMDWALAQAAIDKMLGGEGAAPGTPQGITPLEEGVLEFLIVKILSELGRPAVLDRLLTQTKTIPLLEDEKTPLALLTFRVRLHQTDGYIRIALPLPLVADISARLPPPAHLPFFEERIRSFGHFRTVLWAEAGNVSLSVSDLENLERGDIILFDEAYSNLEGGKLTGSVMLRIGAGKEGGMDAVLRQEEKGFSARVARAF